jgi:KUP system potassium uptake protein
MPPEDSDTKLAQIPPEPVDVIAADLGKPLTEGATTGGDAEPARASTGPRPSWSPKPEHAPESHGLLALCIAALGVVYGDIGTSPLYALRECFFSPHGISVTPAHVYGVLSLIFWSLTITISLKYVAYVLRADNHGEGGVLALMSLVIEKSSAKGRAQGLAVFLGVLGAALLYGDGMITPAISVLSAVEGLVVVAPDLGSWVLPITMIILVLLFASQKYGTARVGAIFGPVTLLWFMVLAALGLYQIRQYPQILLALSPHHAAHFLMEGGWHGFLILGAVFLVVTGGEALYADMGHLGIRPIRVTWFFLVGPALLLNYLGQGAFVLTSKAPIVNPFFEMAPRWALAPLIALSTAATVIASQALISGAFSVTHQAIMLGFLPRMKVRHTSARQIGQVYVPVVNWLLLVCTLIIVAEFRTSGALAAAYGVAVTMTMVITTVLAHSVARRRWGFSPWLATGITTVFLIVDGAFLAANATKFADGGWVPLFIAAGISIVMLTWRRGRRLLEERVRQDVLPLDDFFEVMRVELPARAPGTAVFLTSNSDGTPTTLMQNFLHNRVVHRQVILLTVATEPVPAVPAGERTQIQTLEHGFVRIVAHYGFMEEPDLLQLLKDEGTLVTSLEGTTFFLGSETIRIRGGEDMARWRKSLYALLARNSARAPSYFRLPPSNVIEISSPIEM